MAKGIKLPRFGKTMEGGAIVNCLVKVGQKISKGDVLFEIETDKATLEMESPAEGFVKAIVAQNDQTVAVGDVLLILGEENEKVNISTAVKKSSPKTVEKIAKTTAKEDIAAAIKETMACGQQNYKLGQKVPLSKLGRITAGQMVQSKREKPCFYLSVNVDVTELAALEQKLKVSVDDFIIKALALGLVKWPIMTGRLEEDSVKLADSPGIGIAIAVKDGIVAVVVKDADKKSLSQIAQYSKDLSERLKSGKLSADDFKDGCITVSNLGSLGAESFIPVVIPSQCSILGVGKITDTCVLHKDNMVIHKFMKMTLAVDHRIANGTEAAQFLSYVVDLLGEPQKLQ
ncbi:MAG: 2-oxo acid dehydrogenase subunit E2 [Planctomycetes bacterium]|nr:2-oxo acid dehydrogenase subunit E2 [Planctomycetota bacterium]